ncbi:MAG: heavy metal translocating P-type ATPase [Rhodobiaceae bacterium]|nr:heavy metal translocating P-type ATPase [Rhodobiaceae bacterium]
MIEQNSAASLAGKLIHMPVEGMHCGNCASRLQAALEKVPGLEKIHVELALERAHFAAPDAGTVRAAEAAVTSAGYAVPHQVVQLDIDGMHCGNCASRVETALNAVPGVLSASVNAASESARIEVAEGVVQIRDLIAAVEGAGYKAFPPKSADTGTGVQATAEAERSRALGRDMALLAGAVLLTLPLVLPMAAMPFGFSMHLPAWFQFALAAPVQVLVGWRFYRGAYSALRHGAANMDVLVSLGTSAAFFYSLAVTLSASGGPLYFEASAVVLTLVLAGKLLEARAKRGASAAVRALMDLRPRVAVKIDENGIEQEVPVDALEVGDRILVRPGGRIPADGVIRAGAGEIDEALVTGESVPVARAEGDRVIEGAINGTGRLEIEVAAIGADTTLARVIRLVEQAQAGKAPVQRLVDRVAAVFVPVVLVIAVVTFGGWLFTGADLATALSAGVAVLVIACPCALGLATPAALVAGTGSAARAGILIKDIEALEHLARVDTIVFDKTGTLTEGKPKVVSMRAFDMGEQELLMLTVSLVGSSEHPLSRAIRAHAGEACPTGKLTDFRNIAGAGVAGRVDGTEVAVGKPAWLRENGIDITQADTILSELSERAETPVVVAAGGRLAGVFGLADTLREGAADAVRELRAQGVEPVLMSGDAAAVARAIGARAGIEKIAADMKPEDKAQEVARLGRDGRHPAMVGDGVNDAAALAAADVGIAMGSGTDVAMEAASVTLMRPEPLLVPAAREIARQTARTIRQNLFWAFAYNVIGIPLAAFGLLSPAFAGGAMALSSVTVVGNALRLTRWKPGMNKS